MTTPWLIWGGALALYLLFRLWYDGFRKPLTKAEIDVFFDEVQSKYGGGNDPDSGEQVPGRTMMRRYSDPFVKALIRRGGHPVMAGVKVGPYVDAWNVEGDPGWSIFGLMRYRSRRDMIAMVRDPLFARVHPYKLLGIPTTFSFPTQRQVSVYLGPRATVALVLALGAALVQLAAMRPM